MGGSSWIWWLFLPVVGWLLFRQIRHMAQQHSSVRWPAVDATIQKGPTGLVPVVGRGPTSACFIGYCFSVEGERYTGLFALYGREDNVERVHTSLLVQSGYAITQPTRASQVWSICVTHVSRT